MTGENASVSMGMLDFTIDLIINDFFVSCSFCCCFVQMLSSVKAVFTKPGATHTFVDGGLYGCRGGQNDHVFHLERLNSKRCLNKCLFNFCIIE